MSVLEEEVTAIIGAARYERDLETSVGKITNLVVPRTWQRYQPHVFERYHRKRAEVDAAVSEMFVAELARRVSPK